MILGLCQLLDFAYITHVKWYGIINLLYLSLSISSYTFQLLESPLFPSVTLQTFCPFSTAGIFLCWLVGDKSSSGAQIFLSSKVTHNEHNYSFLKNRIPWWYVTMLITRCCRMQSLMSMNQSAQRNQSSYLSFVSFFQGTIKGTQL